MAAYSSTGHKHEAMLLYKRPYAGKGNPSETHEFQIRVNIDNFNNWKKHPNEVAIVDVVDSWDVFKAQTRAHTGALERPSKQELEDAFGTSNFEEIFKFMVEHGHLHNAGKQGALEGHEKGAFMGTKHGVQTEALSAHMR